MIWFACRSCGKKHSRPDNSAGSMIFCDCGQSLMVPWESTIEPGEMPPAPSGPPGAPWPGWEEAESPPLPMPGRATPTMPPPLNWAPGEAPPAPRLVPVPVSEERVPPVRPPRPPDEPYPAGDLPYPPAAMPYPARRRTPVLARDRNFCFNHQDLPVDRTCESCAERFCAHCLVTFQGKILCGPCKNALVKSIDEPPKISGLAITAAILGVVFSLGSFCLLPLGTVTDPMPFLIVALLLQMGNLGMAALAVYHTEKTSLLRGKSLALTGVIASAVGILLTVVTAVYSYMQWV